MRAIITPFYRSHAGLLFLVFYVMFGMVESGQLISYHTALIEGMFSSFYFLVCVCIIWALYSFKILLFILNLLRQPDYHFANHLNLLPQPKVFRTLFAINCAAFLPVLCYSLFIYQIGLAHHNYISCLYIFLFQAALCSLNAWIILMYFKTQHKFTWQAPHLRLPSVGGKIGFYISYFIGDEKVALFLSKLFSLSLLYFVRENTGPGDDFRITGLAWLFALASNTFLILKIRTFEDRYLTWTKALPIGVGKTYLLTLIFYVLVLWPEFLMITTEIGETISIREFIILILFSGGFMMAIHAYLLKPNRNTDQFSMYLFWLFIASFFIILSKLIIMLTIVLCISSFVLTSRRYYEYEPVLHE